ncbi:MAG: 4'-phosphopantetheinyl transferase superfamily protein [Bacteroidota bacterium]
MPVLFKKVLNDDTLLGVWHITESVDELVTLANPIEYDLIIHDTFKNENRKKQWLSYRILIHELIEESHQISYTDFGKPFLKLDKNNNHLSVTHAGEYSAVVINECCAVGIDIEKSTKRIERVKERFLSDAELKFMDTANYQNHLTICWTVKEALFKLEGNSCFDFKKQIFLEPFEYAEQGMIDCRVTGEKEIEKFKVCYEKIGEYFLSYVVGSN